MSPIPMIALLEKGLSNPALFELRLLISCDQILMFEDWTGIKIPSCRVHFKKPILLARTECSEFIVRGSFEDWSRWYAEALAGNRVICGAEHFEGEKHVCDKPPGHGGLHCAGLRVWNNEGVATQCKSETRVPGAALYSYANGVNRNQEYTVQCTCEAGHAGPHSARFNLSQKPIEWK